jgi:hypothetical protein
MNFEIRVVKVIVLYNVRTWASEINYWAYFKGLC